MVDSRDSLLMMIVCLLLLIISMDGMVIVLQPSESVRELASRTSKRVSCQSVSSQNFELFNVEVHLRGSPFPTWYALHS